MNGAHTETPQRAGTAVPVILEEMKVRRGDFTLGPVSTEIPAGAVTAVTGPSGAGKSTLLRAVIGLERTEGGTVRLGEKELSETEPAERRIGFVFQDAFLYPHMTSGANLSFPLRLKKMGKERISERVEEVIEEFRLPSAYLQRHVHELPQGIRQLFAVGKGRMREFDLLLLDEPFQHLDAAIHRDVRLVLQQLVRHLGRTVVVSLTEAEDVLAMSDYALVLQEGRLIEEGESGALYRQPETLCAMEMLSPLGLNRIPVEVSGERVRSLGLPAAGCVDGVKELCFRPEDAGPEAPYELPFELERRAVFDGKRDLLEGRIGGELVSLMWPVSADTPSRVFLRTYRLFDRTAP